jgi:hypothetical protein
MRRALPRLTLLVLVLLAAAPALRAAPAAAPVPKQTFDLVVSTEWQPGSEPLPDELAAAGCPAGAEATFLDDLAAGLHSMADFFYGYTAGQLAIGKITIYTGGAQWDTANIRVLANRSYRPTAFVGGVVGAPTAYYSDTGSLSPAALFFPEPILISRQWDGRGARCGPWSAPDGWRTLGHEWAHYALYLYDEYMNQPSAAEQLCDRAAPGFRVLARGEHSGAATGTTIASLMGYHYTADQLSLWPAGAAPPAACRDTPQATVHGQSDWATVARFYAGAGVTAPDVLAPAPSPAPPVTIEIAPGGALAAHASAGVTLARLPRAGLVAQAYLVRPGGTGGAPARIIGQGNIVAGEAQPMRFWGARPDLGDRVALVAQDPLGGARYGFPLDYRPGVAALSTSATNALSAPASTWNPSLRIAPRVTTPPGSKFGTVDGLHVELTECGAKALTAVDFVYCPAGGGCGAPVAATESGGMFSANIFPPGGQVAPHGYIYAREPFRGAETIAWYQLGGGVGPAHTGGHAPLADALVDVDLAQNDPSAPGSDNRVLFSPAQVCAAGTLPPGVLGIIGPPMSVQATIASANGGQPWDGTRPPLRVRLGYDQDLLDRLGIAEERLVLLRLSAGTWQTAKIDGHSAALDWIAGAPVAFSAQGEVYALGYGPARLSLPLLRRGP